MAEIKINIDELTGISDFRSFIREAEELLKANPDRQFDILIWDIVQFKVINDLYGMEAGDRLLREIAQAMKNGVKQVGVCGRAGSNKFAACLYADCYKLEELTNLYDFYVDDTIGVHKVLMQAGCYHVTHRDVPVIKMCDRAILALGNIKGKYTESVSEYVSSNRDDVLLGQQLAHDLDTGIKERQFKAYIQPIYNATSARISSGEVLVRWEHPKFGFMAPGRFIGYFEKNYLVTKLDKFVWEEACRMIRRMMDEGRRVIPLSVNVSRMDFLYDDLSEVFKALVDKYEIDPKYLKIEITESAYMDNPEKLEKVAAKLHQMGFLILMDDFGTGYSSLNTLRKLSFDILKIDKALVDEIDSSVEAGNIVSSIINMTKWLGMETVAEGVEKVSQVEFLRHMDCNYIQGYYFSKPLCEEDFFKLDFDDSHDIKKDSEEINLDALFSLKDSESRRVLDKLVGALAYYELDDDKLVLKKVNDEFYKMFDLTPFEVFEDTRYLLDEISIERVRSRCEKAMTSNEPVSIELNGQSKSGNKIWILTKIYYVGHAAGKPQFVFNLINTTKENYKRNKQQVRDVFTILRSVYSELLKLDYTRYTITTLACNELIKTRYDDDPINIALDNLITVLQDDDCEKVREELSYEKMMAFFTSDAKNKTIKVKTKDIGSGVKKCEILVLRNYDDTGDYSVIIGSRVIE